MIGSCLMIGLKAPQLTEEEKDFIVSNHVAGVILFKRNIQSFKQLYDLCFELKSLTHPSPLIAIDMEGGEVNRFSHLKESFVWPSPQVLRRLDLKQVSFLAFSLAKQLKLLGVDINFAPVVDLPIVANPLLTSRIFGETKSEIIKYAGAFLKGLEQGQIISCLKHFPGHGGVQEDSHKSLPEDFRTLKDIQPQLEVFQALFETYKSCWIMTAHIQFPKIEKIPATFSSLFLQSELKTRRAFKGLVVSDDIDMEALGNFSSGEKFFYALKAGCHLVLACQKEDTAREVMAYFEKQPEKKEEITAELKEASEKLLTVREEYSQEPPPFKEFETELLELKKESL